MILQVPADLVEFYLSEFTITWFEDNEDAPDNLDDYNELIEGVRRHLRDENEAELFQAALAYLIHGSDEEVENFDGGSGFSAAELRTLMRHIYQRIWGDVPNSPMPVEWV